MTSSSAARPPSPLLTGTILPTLLRLAVPNVMAMLFAVLLIRVMLTKRKLEFHWLYFSINGMGRAIYNYAFLKD